jgi:DNA-directed RNA polymerase specialized sigma24 family protein
LTRLRELSNKEAAQVLELSEQTVKNQLSIGLKALRQELSRLAVPLWLLFFIN